MLLQKAMSHLGKITTEKVFHEFTFLWQLLFIIAHNLSVLQTLQEQVTGL